MPERFIVAIEIGSSKLRGAVGTADDMGMTDVLAVEEEKLTGSVRYGCINNVEISNALSRICERLEQYPRVAPRQIKGVYVGLGGRSMISAQVDVEARLPAEMEITREMIADLRARAARNVSSERDVADVVAVRYTVDNRQQANPVGCYGTSVGARMCVVTCATVIKRMIRRVLSERLGLEINGYVTRPLAEGAISLTDDERRQGCMLVDFGAETTTVVIYKDGAPVYVVTLPLGSRNITLDLKKLNYIEERAEEIKKVSGNAMGSDSPRYGADGIDYSEVNNYVHARAAEIVINILAQIEYAGLKSSDLPGGIIIVGGGARLRGFTELLAQQSKLKVRMGTIQSSVRISDPGVNPGENIDIISILAAAAKMPPAECMDEPEPVDEPEDGFDEGDGDEEGSRIGRLDDDDPDVFSDHPEKKKKKKVKGGDEEEKPHRPSIFGSLYRKIAGIMDDDGDEL